MTMNGLLFIMLIVAILTLVMVASVEPARSKHSVYELRRRRADERLELDRRREAAYRSLDSLQRIVTAILLVAITAISFGLFNQVGALLALVVAVIFGAVSRLKPVRRAVHSLYARLEPQLLECIERHTNVIRPFYWAGRQRVPPTVGSKEELIDIAIRSKGILSDHDVRLMTAAFAYESRRVKDVMTPRRRIRSVKKGEVMGPLVLDDLHKTGHDRFPVIDGDIDHVIGIIQLRDVLIIDTTRKTTARAESVMDKHVYFIHEDQVLLDALPAFLSTHYHMFMVVNDERQTVGLLSLEDVIESLIGRRVIDKYDTHDDPEVVAKRAPRTNDRTDVSARSSLKS